MYLNPVYPEGSWYFRSLFCSQLWISKTSWKASTSCPQDAGICNMFVNMCGYLWMLLVDTHKNSHGFEYFLIFLNTFGYCLEIFSLICLFWWDTLRFWCFWILWDTPKTATFFWIPGRVILDTIGMHICICSICICYSHSSCSKSSAPHSAFASARLMALRRLVAGRALDFEQI